MASLPLCAGSYTLGKVRLLGRSPGEFTPHSKMRLGPNRGGLATSKEMT
jgi:hypothetical protein